MIIKEIFTIIIGYLLGSIPSAYIVTRLATGKDIRRMGGGNVGGLNVRREVGAWPALAVGTVDVSKGAASVAIAYWLLDVPVEFVLLTGLAAVIGHNWMVWLKFSGGKGMGPAIGALTVLMLIYGYWPGLLIFFGFIAVPLVITRNIALSMGTGLVSLPVITWLSTKSGIATTLAVVLGLLILIKFLPTARLALSRAETIQDFIFDRWQRGGRG